MTRREALIRFRDVWQQYLRENRHITPDDKVAKRTLWNDWTDALQKDGQITEHQYDTWSGPPGLDGLERYNQSDYTYYIITKSKKIMSGWSYREDAQEILEDDDIPNAKVYSKTHLLRMGIDPNDDANWTSGSSFEGLGYEDEEEEEEFKIKGKKFEIEFLDSGRTFIWSRAKCIRFFGKSEFAEILAGYAPHISAVAVK